MEEERSGFSNFGVVLESDVKTEKAAQCAPAIADGGRQRRGVPGFLPRLLAGNLVKAFARANMYRVRTL